MKYTLQEAVLIRVVNSHEELCRPPYQTRNPQQGIAVPLLMLLCQVRFTNSLFSTDTAAFVSDRDNGLSSSVSRNTAHSDNSGNGFSALLSPVRNALYEAGEFMARHDPVKLPGADAAVLPDGRVNSILATDIAKGVNEGRYCSGEICAKKGEIIGAREDRDGLIAIIILCINLLVLPFLLIN